MMKKLWKMKKKLFNSNNNNVFIFNDVYFIYNT